MQNYNYKPNPTSKPDQQFVC